MAVQVFRTYMGAWLSSKGHHLILVDENSFWLRGVCHVEETHTWDEGCWSESVEMKSYISYEWARWANLIP